MPKPRAARHAWYRNIRDSVESEAVKIGGKPEDAATLKTLASDIVDKMDATDQADRAASAARQSERDTEAAALKQFRAIIRHWKTLPNYAASGSEAALKLHGTDAALDRDNYKPAIQVSLAPGKVLIKFIKKGATGVAIYSRLSGAADWRKIGTATRSPFTDKTPLARAGVPELREYMARGILHDAEFGQDSDVANITFAG